MHKLLRIPRSGITGTFTLFGQASNGALAADTTTNTLGVQFSVAGVMSARLTAVWFYSAPAAVNLPTHIQLWQVSGRSNVTNPVVAWSGAAGSGWVRAAFAAPPQLTPGASYKACVLNDNGASGNWYSTTGHYWDTGAGQNGITSGPLSAPNNAGGDGGQDTFNAGATLTYPLSVFNATNYWVDPEVTVP